jgi:O-antigen biosynthesis protein WbqV
VHVLDMGKPLKVVDLARQMIRLSGKRPDEDIKIAFVGLRPGEKLHEELVHAQERQTRPQADGGAFSISPRTTDLAILRRQLAELARVADAFDETKVLRLIKAAVPEFALQGDVSEGGRG